MKRHVTSLAIILLFIGMLVFQQAVFQGASEGLLLWFNIVLPTLLPFIIISNLLIQTNSMSYISHIAGPIIARVFSVSKTGSFAVLVGFLCGYPMGAKVTSDLVKSKRISLNEGTYLLSFCNNTSPAFIMSYVVWQNLEDEALILPSLIILYAAPILCSMLFRLYYRESLRAARLAAATHTTWRPSFTPIKFSIMDTCIMNGLETIVKVGGYIMLFSVLLTLFQLAPIQLSIWRQVLLPMMEITNGVPLLMEQVSDSKRQFIYILSLTSFGGLCAIAQTKCMIQGTALKIKPYIIQKLITTFVTSLLAYAYLFFI